MAAVKLLLFAGLVHPLRAMVLSSKPLGLLNSNHTMEWRSFNPTDQDVQSSMSAIMHSMTDADALKILENEKKVPRSLVASVETVLASAGTRHHALRASQPDVDTTRTMLNEMLYESLKKYDLEQAKCSNYYAKQCAEMESCRGEISAVSGAAAACKGKTLSAQGAVDIAQKDLPKKILALEQHGTNCDQEVNATKKHLSRVMGDISVMTSILKMTDCSKKGFIQTGKPNVGLGLLHCKTACTSKTFVSFEDAKLREEVSEIESPVAHQALQETLQDLANSSSAGPVLMLAQDGTLSEQLPKKVKIKKAPLAKKPAPRQQAPPDPCEDPNAGAPNAANKRAAKCTMSGNPNCQKMTGRFLFIQAGMMDERDNLKEELSELEERCELQTKTLGAQVEQEESKLKDEQTKLAEATSCESTASEKGRLVGEQHEELTSDVAKMQKQCQTNFQGLLTEQCGLRKIRGEVLKLSGVDANIQDCKLGPWEPGQCSKKCGGGKMTLTRSVMMPDNGGAKCLPFTQSRTCNDGPCPINCKIAEWSKWSRCSAECGGGITQRARDVKVHMRYGGKSCGQTTMAKACNAHACDEDCSLKRWTKWTKCSKQCDGGTSKRTRFVKKAAVGEGKCADDFDKTRLEYKKCNYKPCKKVKRKGKPTLQCKSNVDVILLLDGSSGLGNSGWRKTIEAAKLFVSSFQDNKKARVSVLTFSGPQTWSGVSRCMGEVQGAKPVNMDKDCQISWASRFTGNMKKLSNKLDGLSWPKGGSLTSLALSAAENELQLARKGAKAVVVVVTDGRPLSFRRTALASERIKKAARLVWVPVSKFGPLDKFKTWATRRWQENVVQVPSYNQLATPVAIDHLIANICPKVSGGVGNIFKKAARKMKKMVRGKFKKAKGRFKKLRRKFR